MDKKKKLEHLADDMLRKVEYSDALRKIAEEGDNVNIIKAIDNMLTAATGEVEDLTRVEKFNRLYEVIESNIKRAREIKSNNFPYKEYVSDKKEVFECAQIYNASLDQEVKTEALYRANKIYNKHVAISKIINS